jgi:phenylalanyl-tRNA synthetase beta chain
VALVLPEEVSMVQVQQALAYFGRPWLEEVRLFDVYSGPPIPPGKRSLAFHLSYRDPEKTLTDETVDRHHEALVTALGEKLGAELR